MSTVQAVSVALGVGVLKFAAGKIIPVITSEISSIKGVTKDLSELRDIHKKISNYLEIGKDSCDPSLSLVITKLKKVADDIDGLVHEAHQKIIDIDGEKYVIVDYFPTKPKSFISRVKIAHRIRAINKTYAAILKQKCDTNIILENFPLEHPVAVQGMRAGELYLLSKVEEQKIQGNNQGEEDNECTLSDSDEGMDEDDNECAVSDSDEGMDDDDNECKLSDSDEGMDEDDNECTLSDSDEGMDDWIIIPRNAET